MLRQEFSLTIAEAENILAVRMPLDLSRRESNRNQFYHSFPACTLNLRLHTLTSDLYISAVSPKRYRYG